MLYATVRQRKIQVKNPMTVVQKGVGVDHLTLDMDDEWKDMASIKCVFTNGDIQKEILYSFGETVEVPWECLAQKGDLSISCTGYGADGEKVMTTMLADSYWTVVENGPMTGSTPLEPTPSLYDQIMAETGNAHAAAITANRAAAELLHAKEAGEFNGISPTVTLGTVIGGVEAQVTNSGTPHAAVFDFVLPRGATGPKGDRGNDGRTPVKGKDYLTPEDVDSLTQAVSDRIKPPTGQDISTTPGVLDPVTGQPTDTPTALGTMTVDDFLSYLYGQVEKLEAERQETTESQNCHAAYFDLNEEGELSLQAAYRGACPSNFTQYPAAVSDLGYDKAGSRNGVLPEDLYLPCTVGGKAVKSLAKGMFLCNKSVKHLRLPRGITVIPERFCYEATDLRQVHGTLAVTQINGQAFIRTHLERAEYPALTLLGQFVFAYCPFLTYANIGDQVTEIPNSSFFANSSLETLAGGAAVTAIGNNAFERAVMLKQVGFDFENKVQSIGDAAFLNSRVNVDWRNLPARITQGSFATPAAMNPTDFWSQCSAEYCQNPMPAVLSQTNDLWSGRNIGSTQIPYSGGCILMSLLHIYCAMNPGANFSDPRQFEKVLNKVDPKLLQPYHQTNNPAGFRQNLLWFCMAAEKLDMETETMTELSSANLQHIYDSLAQGKYVVLTVPTGKSVLSGVSGALWHIVTAYGITKDGELMIADSAAGFSYLDGYSHMAQTHMNRAGNLLPVNPAITGDVCCVIVSPKEQSGE